MNGQLNSDGNASGTLRADMGSCSISNLNWETTFDGELPHPEPSEPGTPDPSESGSAKPKPSTNPSEDDLTDDLDRAISAPATARAGAQITVGVEGVADGAQVGVWLFSSATYLGSHTVNDGAIRVTIPNDTVPGEYTIAVYSADGLLIGWDTLAITAADGADQSGVTDDQDAKGTKGDKTSNESGSSDGSLASTGANIGIIAALGAVLLGTGALLIRRRRSTE